MSDSPNSLAPAKGIKGNNRIVFIAIVVAIILVGVMLYSVSKSMNQNKKTDTAPNTIAESDMKQPLNAPETFGLSLPPKGEKEEAQKLPAQEKPLVTVVRPPETSEIEKLRLKELRELRTFKLERMKAALAAPLKVSAAIPEKKNTQIVQTATGDVRSRHPLTMQGMSAAATAEGNDQKDKEDFLSTRAAKDGSWQLPYERVPGKRFELKTGSVIAGIMITGINSDLPGQIIGQVSQNIYDTATGQYMRIPLGARMIGVYD